MQRVSEVFLLGERRLREASTDLHNSRAVVGFKKNSPPSPETPIEAALKNTSLKPTYEPTDVGLILLERNISTSGHALSPAPKTALSSLPGWVRVQIVRRVNVRGLLPWSRNELVRVCEVIHVRPNCSLRGTTR